MRFALPKGADRATGQPDRSSRDCRSPATTRCIPSSSTRRAISSSIPARRPIPARRRTACSNRRDLALHGARDARRHLALRRQQDRPDISRLPSAIVTGMRNGEGFGFDAAAVFATQHGRDQLWQNWPKLYTPETRRRTAGGGAAAADQAAPISAGRNAISTASEEARAGAGIWRRWRQDGGVCAEKQAPVAFFPAHWAPNDLMIDNFRVSGRLSRRRLHRLPRFVESRPAASRAAIMSSSNR